MVSDGLSRTRHSFLFFNSTRYLTNSSALWHRCTLPKLRTRTAKSAINTWNSRLLNTRKARTPRRRRVRAAISPSKADSVVRPSLLWERRLSRPKRSPSDSNAPSARSDAASSLEDARLSSWVPTPRRTSLAPSSESSNASGKALRPGCGTS